MNFEMSGGAGGGSGGWELSKENIQPLTSGRRMAYLAESLPTRGATLNDHELEAQHWEEFSKLEGVALKQAGDDPLQAWVDLVKYIEQHFPVMSAKVNSKFKESLRKAVQLNFGNEYYKNDRRYVELVLKNVEFLPDIMHRLGTLRHLLEGGIGEFVSPMYIKLAEMYEAQGDEKSASDILRKGIQKNAEPKSSIEEMLTHIQNRWAERYAKTLENGSAGDAGGERNFASSVPTVGRNNEAISIRRDLPPAAPATDRHNTKMPMPPSRVHILNEENSAPSRLSEKENLQQFAAPTRISSLERAEYDTENRLEATRWNNGYAQLDNPAIPQPPEKLNFNMLAKVKVMYVEEPVSHHSASKPESSHAINARALKERTEPTEESDPQANAADNQIPLCSSAPSTYSVNPIVKFVEDCQKKGIDEDVKYKPLPPRFRVNRMMMKVAAYFKENDAMRMQEEMEVNEVASLRLEVLQLKECVKVLEEKLKDQLSLTDLKLMQKDEKIAQLELGSDNLMNQVTQLTTSNNVLESRLQREKGCFEKEIDDLRKKLTSSRKLEEEIEDLRSKLANACELENEAKFYREQYENLFQEKMARQSEVYKEIKSESDYEHALIEKKSNLVDIDVQRNVNYVSSSSEEQDNADASIFRGGDNAIAANSYLPELGNGNSIGYNQSLRERKGLSDIHKGNDHMMDLTPVVLPDELDIPPPNFSNLGLKKPAFSLYESISESFSRPNPPKANSLFNNKRTDIFKSLHMLPENLPPPPLMSSVHSGPAAIGEEPPFEPQAVTVQEPVPRNENFLRPGPPSRKSIVSFPTSETLRSSADTNKNAAYSRQLGSDSDSGDEEIMIRRHQQTGVDLNMTNLTCALSMYPAPLTNSTPEKTRNRPVSNFPIYSEEPPAPDFQTVAASRMPRYNSVLNEDPGLNLSTIQETSRENRSRSTTSSSSGNYTASTTRFGTTSTTPFYNNVTRSSSIPRSNSHISQLYNNGYHSDTNGK
ncbi:Mitotic checkpoint serine/threonine-protein kinase BUB1 beta [Orchesella cincta]|uniref:Mitotic checkpoint serine/threonine-protein kinase BUB1 beta n=1 Tax=Orchesella cincta TaxID=48709 RepID=A0A1D2N6F2_ORCCI|nr:Mitotic checkpoint serine/threonine-protein kinase BUB1 beta [Orchesella cincta]